MTSLLEQPVALVVAAQLHDMQISCLGTLVRLRQAGWRVAFAALCGPHRMGGEYRLRRDTSHNLAHQLDADVYVIDGPEYSVIYSEEGCRCVAALIRSVRPAMILTHGPYDARPDCEQTSRILRQAALLAPLAHYPTHTVVGGSGEPTARVPHLYYCDPHELIDAFGRPVEPSLIVDISPVVETKHRLIAQYITEDKDAASRLTNWETWSRRRGEQAGFTYGEGFWQHVAAPFPRDDLLSQVLGEAARLCPAGPEEASA